MKTYDRAFLKDMAQLIPMNHIAAVHALMGIEVATCCLPSLEDLAGSVQQPILDALTKLYHEGPKFLYDVAKEYRAKRDSFQKVFSKGSPPLGWEKDINIIIDVFPSSTARVPSTR